MLEFFRQTVRSFHLNIRIPNADQIGDQLHALEITFLSVVLRMLLNASIFHLWKSPGNSSPNIDLAEMILIEELTIIPCDLGR